MFSNPQKNLNVFGITAGMKVADFGVGGGFYTLPIARMIGEEGTIYALDLQEGLLHKVKNEGIRMGLSNIKTLEVDLEDETLLPIKENYLDAAVVANILFQLTNKENIIKKINAVLRPGGKVLVIDWTDSFGGLGPQEQFVYPEKKAKELFLKFGFKVVNTFNAGDHHYGIIFKK